VGLAGCAARAPNLPPIVPEGVEQRTGHAVRPLEERPDGTLPAGVNLADGVTEEEAVAAALWNNAGLSADLAGLGVAKADLIEAGTWRNPSLQLLLPVGLKPFELAISYPLEVFWQRPKRMAAARKQWDQVAESLVQNGLDTARDARQAQAALVQAQDRARVSRELADLARQIAELADARLRAGDISELEADVVRAGAGMAEEQSRRTAHDTVIARERLRFVMGLASAPDLRAVASDPGPTTPPPADQLRETALGSRPDLRALEVGVVAAAARAKWERSRLVTLGAILSSKEVGTSGVLTGPGISAEIPIFRTNAGSVAKADAEVELAARRYAARRQLVDLEVVEARAMLVQALDSLADWHDRVVPQLARAAEKARHAYEAGDVSYLVVLDTTRQWTDAALRDIDLTAAARRAAAELDRSVGTRVTRGVLP
jgi:cobalt-zinc-cadmium efflux system outer membrane protein